MATPTMMLYVDNSDSRSNTVQMVGNRLRIKFSAPLTISRLGVEKLSVYNVRLPLDVQNLYLCCDITRMNLYNGKEAPVIFAVTKGAVSTVNDSLCNRDVIVIHSLF